ncbi:MAG TPA: CDP-diacylglycerol--glycerol-3-phosphate 3-phosphatidyltransferase [Solirubrobacteraceae bacterium]
MEAGALRGTQRRGGRRGALLVAGTSSRIIATPVVMALVLNHSYTAAAILFMVVSATDWFDGRLARRWGVSSQLGSFLDTTADKLLVTGALIALVTVGRASPWIALIMIGREMIVLGLRAAVAAQGLHLEASMLGKWKATVQFVAIAVAMLRPDVTIGGALLDQWLLVVAAVVTVWSGVDYFMSFSSALRSE